MSRHQPFSPLSGAVVERYGPEEEAHGLQAGTVFCSQSKHNNIKEAQTTKSNLSSSTQQDIIDLHNIYQHFELNIDDFGRYINDLNNVVKTAQPHHSAAGSRTYIWLDPEDTGWWLTAMKTVLDDCFRLIREEVLTLLDVERN